MGFINTARKLCVCVAVCVCGGKYVDGATASRFHCGSLRDEMTLSQWCRQVISKPSLIAVNKYLEQIFHVNCTVL